MTYAQDGSTPAFPTPQVMNENGDVIQYTGEGMSKRELIATKALQGLLASMPADSGKAIASGKAFAAVAEIAAKFADALIEQLAKDKDA